MDDDLPLIDRVAELRARGLRPKEIARALGIRPAQVEPLLRQLAQAAPPVEPALVGCWISAGWSTGLGISGEHGWEDDLDAEGNGLVIVAVARAVRPGRLTVANFLVDPWCLGVKNADARSLAADRLDGWRSNTYRSFPDGSLACSIELARHFVLGAAAWAEALGFAPHPDFAAARPVLGPWQGPSAIQFGKDGAPAYFQGPHDDLAHVMSTLAAAHAQGALAEGPAEVSR